MSVFSHSGELGDIIYMLPLLRAIGGRHTIRLVDRVKEPPFSRPIVSCAPFISPLLKAQPYIGSVDCSSGDGDFRMYDFRAFHEQDRTLTKAQVDYYNFKSGQSLTEDGSEPWLTTGSKREPSGRVVIARSSRYNGLEFPWKAVMDLYKDRTLFIGLPHEHRAFQKKYGTIEHRQVKDMLEMAKVMANAELFIGNQSSPMAVAIGLGVPFIQEVFIHQPDCIFGRQNAQYSYNGGCRLPDVAGSGGLVIEDNGPDIDLNVHREFHPGVGWRWPGLKPTPWYWNLVRDVMKLEGISREEADRRVVTYNIKLHPDFYRSPNADGKHDVVIRAIANAGATPP